ncbi:MGDG synthase family glycosyltransferase [Heliomicrobium modesticaldum]|nr:glycosyltransferase [Heliomicrobium modesticaldum]
MKTDASREQTDVLILSVEAGTGHGRAAQAVAKALACRGMTARIEDAFAFGPHWVFASVIGTYLRVLQLAPSLYRFLYYSAARPKAGFLGQQLMTAYLEAFIGEGMADLIRRSQPKAILCTHPFPMGVLCRFQEKGWLKQPLAGVVTDFCIHPFWAFPGVHRYYVAGEALLDELASYGLDRERGQVTGIPIDQSFQQAARLSRSEAEAQLGLSPSRRRLLVMGGGLGLGPVEDWVRGLLKASLADMQIVVIAGRNEDLERRLRTIIAPPERLVVLGFTDRVPALMACSDLFITKPGGLSSSEALAMGLPQILFPPLPGHEEVNQRFLIRHHSAWEVKEEELIAQVEAILADERELEKRREAARRLGNVFAADAVAADVAKLIG